MQQVKLNLPVELVSALASGAEVDLELPRHAVLDKMRRVPSRSHLEDKPSDQPPVMQSPPGAEVVIDGHRYLYFGGTSYLGLAGHPEVIEAACEATRRYGIHSATSRAGFGNSPPVLEVERLAAEFFGTEDAFYFVSGYVGNHILIQALAAKFDAVFVDGLSHYCVNEAIRLAHVPVYEFRHRDPDDLRAQLEQHVRPDQRPLVVTDGVFSMTGAIAPIREYFQILSRSLAGTILIDDAHGVGVLGEHVCGTVEHFGLWNEGVNETSRDRVVAVRLCATLSKAIGGFGGVIPGSRQFLAHARGGSHYFDGASAPPAGAAAATAKALEIIKAQPQLRQRHQENIRRMRSGLRSLGLPVEDEPTANMGLKIGDADNHQRIHTALKRRGILIPFIAKYAGAGSEGLLRIAVFATHTPEMIDRALSELSTLL